MTILTAYFLSLFCFGSVWFWSVFLFQKLQQYFEALCRLYFPGEDLISPLLKNTNNPRSFFLHSDGGYLKLASVL